MPTSTYYNLSEEKKTRIMEASLDEFAAHRFSDASINRIVKAAGIPRGSFYQYFKDKEDLYLLVIDKIGQEKLAVYAKHPAPAPDSTFFEAAVASIPAILEWVERSPRYDQIGMRMAQDDSAFIRHVLERMQSPIHSVLAYLQLDQERGLVRKDVDLELVLQIITPVMSGLLREYYHEDSREAALKKIKQIFDILGNGIFERG